MKKFCVPQHLLNVRKWRTRLCLSLLSHRSLHLGVMWLTCHSITCINSLCACCIAQTPPPISFMSPPCIFLWMTCLTFFSAWSDNERMERSTFWIWCDGRDEKWSCRMSCIPVHTYLAEMLLEILVCFYAQGSEEAKRQKAAAKIQTHYRGYRLRKTQKEMKNVSCGAWNMNYCLAVTDEMSCRSGVIDNYCPEALQTHAMCRVRRIVVRLLFADTLFKYFSSKAWSVSVPSPRGGFRGLTPQTELQSPPNQNMKHCKSV